MGALQRPHQQEGRLRFRPAAVLAVAAALVAGACGSTVPTAGRARSATGAGEAGLNAPAGGAVPEGAVTDELGQPVTGATGRSSAARTAAGRSGSSPSATAASASRPSGNTGPGVTDTEIAIGMEYATDDVVNQAAGLQGTNPGDIAAYYRTMVEDVNKRGGILGRRVKPVIRTFSAGSAADPADEQQACSFFTEDNKVFGVLTRFGIGEAYRGCLQDKGVMTIGFGGLSVDDDQVFHDFPFYVTAGSLSLSRVTRATVDRLFAQGYFSPTSRIGLVTFDDPAFNRAVERGYTPALASHGLKFTDVGRVARPESQADLGAESAGVSGIVLRFKSIGIDRVVFLEGGGDLALLFMNAAESQTYRPRYGLNSQDAGQVMAANVPAAQLHAAVGIGWLPGTDVPAQNDPPNWPARQRCIDVMKANHVSFPTRYAESYAGAVCDQVGLLAAAMSAGGNPVNRERFIAGLDTLGTSFGLAATFAGRFGPGVHDGIGAVRDVAFVDSCACFKYTTGDHPV
jgi:ABC-type branched-subunit amino acid transport system substrate-binding protein